MSYLENVCRNGIDAVDAFRLTDILVLGHFVADILIMGISMKEHK
jgi:hypothetical protein